MKLVRDKIIKIILEQGKNCRSRWDCKYHFAEGEEYEQRLFDKMQEEMTEFMEEPCLEEAADVYEVFLSMLNHWKFDLKDVQETADKKREERGSFRVGYVLENVDKGDCGDCGGNESR